MQKFIINCFFKVPFLVIPTILFLVGFNLCSVTGLDSIQGNYILDANYPILISENAFTGESSTQFGTSVALAGNFEGPNYTDKPSGWVFIGAPTSNSTDPTLKGVEKPGVLWRCSLGRRQNGNTCEILNIDPIPPNKLRYRSPKKDDEGNAWIGGNVEITNGRLVTCGHRYTRGDKTIMNGICFWLKDRLNGGFKADKFQINETGGFHHRLMPFFNTKDPLKDKFFTFEDTKENDQGYDLGLGQVGTSLHMVDNVTGGSELILGAPGVRVASGAIVRYIDNPAEINGPSGRENRDPKDATFSEFVIAYRGTKKQNDVNNHWMDYFGYGVTAGKYFHKDKLLYAGGAPRARNLSGEVVIFEIPAIDKNSLPEGAYKRDIKPILEIYPPILKAEDTDGFGSYFGSVLLSLDIDGDGRDELLVGAPMYAMPRVKSKRSTGTISNSGDHGCVFVYSFTNRSSILNKRTICGDETPGARFGSAISYIRMTNNSEDSNSTKFLYVIIGAPFENYGHGAIYIYKAEGELKSYIQKINAQDVSSIVQGFGSSISLPEDIDGNKTPDLAVGAYKSNHAIVLKTRPRVALIGEVKFLDLLGKNKLKVLAKTLNLEICVQLKQEFGESDRINVWTRIIVDSRLSITGIVPNDYSNYLNKNTTNEITYSIMLRSLECQKVFTKIKKNLQDVDADLSPIKIIQELWFNETQVGVNAVEYKIENDGKGFKVNESGKADFEPLKPSPVAKTTEEFLLQIYPNDCSGDVCRPNLTIHADWFHFEDKEFKVPINEYTIGSHPEMLLRVKISNTGETAILPHFDIDWPWDKHLKVVPSKDSINSFLYNNQSCKHTPPDDRDNRVIYNCQLPKNIIKSITETRIFKLDLKEVFASAPRAIFEVGISVYPSGTTHKKTELKHKLNLKVMSMSAVRVVGSRAIDILRNPLEYHCKKLEFPAHSEEKMKKGMETFQLYSSWRQTFKTHVVGKSGVASVEMSFKLPYGRQTKSGDPEVPIVLIHLNPAYRKENLHCKPGSNGFGSLYFVQQVKPGSPMKDYDTDEDIDDGKELFEAGGKARSEDENSRKSSGAPPVFRRRRRQAISEDEATTLINPEPRLKGGDQTLLIHCNDESAEFKCVTINCTATNVKGNSFVEVAFDMFFVKSEIDKLLEGGMEEALIESTATAEIFKGFNSSNATDNSNVHFFIHDDVAQTKFSKPVGDVAAWIYIVAIVFGIFQLLLIAFILYKCGFFKREAKKQLEHLKVEEVRKSRMLRQSFFYPEPETDGRSLENLIGSEEQTPAEMSDSSEAQVQLEQPPDVVESK